MSLSVRGLSAALFVRVTERSDITCPAVQKAIDDMATEYGRGRRGLLDVLSRGRLDEHVARMIFDGLLSAWVEPNLLELATGKGRDYWIDLCDRKAS